MEIGIDIIEIKRFKKIIKDKKLLKKIFTDNEINYCLKRKCAEKHLAVRFAAKEAVIKALSGYKEKIPFNEIEILNESSGRPYINLLKKGIKKYKCKVSLSHTDSIAIAQTLISIP